MEIKIPFKPNVNAPVIFVKQVSLYSAPRNEGLIRTVKLSRGLNIVWGMEIEEDLPEIHPILLSGHSVGKTTFCRLVRYCLGENRFGSASAESRIRSRLPTGFVAAEVFLKGKQWSVAREFGVPAQAYAAKEKTIEELLENIDKKQNDGSFEVFLEDLSVCTIAAGPATQTPDQETIFTWPHLLAWIARDQEARFQSLWEWRSARSESGSARLKKDHSLYLMRMVLGLVKEKEVAISTEINRLEKELAEQKVLCDQLKAEPDRIKQERELSLSEIVGPSQKISDGNESLFGMDQVVLQMTTSISDEINVLSRKIEEINKRTDHYGAVIDRYEDDIERLLAASKTTVQSLADGSDIERLADLEKNYNQSCSLGNVDVKDCSYYNEFLNNLREMGRTLRINNPDPSRDQLIEALLAWNPRLAAQRDSVLKIRKLNNDAKDEKDRLYNTASEKRATLKNIDKLYAEWKDARDRIEKGLDDEPLREQIEKIETLAKTIGKNKTALTDELATYKANLTQVTNIYNWLIQSVLSDNYSGAVTLPNGELNFEIIEQTGLHGEAVDTLSLVLADIASVFCSVQGTGYHPRLLIHDSPREADLDRHVYDHFLNVSYDISEQLGGTDNAPFQYIVTTTSQPPKRLIDAGIVKLELKAHPETRMLFKCRLGQEAVQEEIFSKN